MLEARGHADRLAPMAALLVAGLVLSSVALAQETLRIVGFRSPTVTLYTADQRELETVEAAQLEWLIGATLTLDRNNQLYYLDMPKKRLYVAAFDFETFGGSGASLAKICARMSASDDTYARAGGFARYC